MLFTAAGCKIKRVPYAYSIRKRRKKSKFKIPKLSKEAIESNLTKYIPKGLTNICKISKMDSYINIERLPDNKNTSSINNYHPSSKKKTYEELFIEEQMHKDNKVRNFHFLPPGFEFLLNGE